MRGCKGGIGNKGSRNEVRGAGRQGAILVIAQAKSTHCALRHGAGLLADSMGSDTVVVPRPGGGEDWNGTMSVLAWSGTWTIGFWW